MTTVTVVEGAPSPGGGGGMRRVRTHGFGAKRIHTVHTMLTGTYRYTSLIYIIFRQISETM